MTCSVSYTPNTINELFVFGYKVHVVNHKIFYVDFFFFFFFIFILEFKCVFKCDNTNCKVKRFLCFYYHDNKDKRESIFYVEKSKSWNIIYEQLYTNKEDVDNKIIDIRKDYFLLFHPDFYRVKYKNQNRVLYFWEGG